MRLYEREPMKGVLDKAGGIAKRLFEEAKAKEVDEHVIALGLGACVDLLCIVTKLLIEVGDDS